MDNNFLELLESVKRRLGERQASGDVMALVEDVLVRQHQQYHDVMAAEATKRQTLLQHVKSLEVGPLTHSMSSSVEHPRLHASCWQCPSLQQTLIGGVLAHLEVTIHSSLRQLT